MRQPLANVTVSCRVTSIDNVPIVVERTMWWPSPASNADYWTEAHNSFGTINHGTRWALAEGEVGGIQNAATYILSANVSLQPGEAMVTLMFEDGTTADRVVNLLALSRTTIDVGGPEAVGRRFGAAIQSLGDVPANLVVERAMYTSPGGKFWAAGTNAVATRLP